MSAYFEALEAHNEAHGEGGSARQIDGATAERLRAFNKAHGAA